MTQLPTSPSPLVSIVIASLDRERFIGKAIDSALEQSYQHIEVVVVDGGSKDRTVEILKAYGNSIRWVSEPDQGESDAYNKGLDLGHGDIVCFLPSDDMLQPNAVEVAVREFLAANDDVGMVVGDGFIIDEEDHITGFVKGVPLDVQFLLNDNPHLVNQPATFLRKVALEQAGRWDIAVPYANDLDLWIRILRQFSGRYVQAPLACHRNHSSSLSVSQFVDALLDAYRVRRRHGGALMSLATRRQLRMLLRYVLFKKM